MGADEVLRMSARTARKFVLMSPDQLEYCGGMGGCGGVGKKRKWWRGGVG